MTNSTLIHLFARQLAPHAQFALEVAKGPHRPRGLPLTANVGGEPQSEFRTQGRMLRDGSGFGGIAHAADATFIPQALEPRAESAVSPPISGRLPATPAGPGQHICGKGGPENQLNSSSRNSDAGATPIIKTWSRIALSDNSSKNLCGCLAWMYSFRRPNQVDHATVSRKKRRFAPNRPTERP